MHLGLGVDDIRSIHILASVLYAAGSIHKLGSGLGLVIPRFATTWPSRHSAEEFPTEGSSLLCLRGSNLILTKCEIEMQGLAGYKVFRGALSPMALFPEFMVAAERLDSDHSAISMLYRITSEMTRLHIFSLAL
jgi:hypothetical protein